jgi:hypothetical protein
MKQFAIFFTLAGFILLFSACGSKENEQLRAENDSLKSELNTKHEIVAVMRDVKVLIDSIDASRQVLRIDLNEGMPYDQFSSRLKNINSYVKQTSSKLAAMAKELKESKHLSSAYLMMVDALQSELQIRMKEVNNLEAMVEQYRTENKGLVKTVQLQQTEMNQMQQKITDKQRELDLLNAKVTEMVSTFKMSEADAVYARAQAVEQAALKTRLAPKRKKETFKEALELYQKALSLGKKEAQEKINALSKKIN